MVGIVAQVCGPSCCIIAQCIVAFATVSIRLLSQRVPYMVVESPALLHVMWESSSPRRQAMHTRPDMVID